jgi:hypothetical protein
MLIGSLSKGVDANELILRSNTIIFSLEAFLSIRDFTFTLLNSLQQMENDKDTCQKRGCDGGSFMLVVRYPLSNNIFFRLHGASSFTSSCDSILEQFSSMFVNPCKYQNKNILLPGH